MISYKQPVEFHQTQTSVSNSRFICSIYKVTSTVEVKEKLALIRAEMPDADHHAYAFRIGYGNSVIEGMSDDGEPSGTSGPPILAILRGSEIGDILIVVTRYFGGTKLGTGGLVRAYGDSARTSLASLPTQYKIDRKTIGIEIPYPLYELAKRLIQQHEAVIDDEVFTDNISIIMQIPTDHLPAFCDALRELTSGQVEPLVFDA
jgi:uncharacterized YigZ family protein